MKRHVIKIAFAALICLTMTSLGCEAQIWGGNTAPTTVSGGAAIVTAAVVQEIDPIGTQKMMGNQEDLQILDVRTPDEIATGVIGQPTKIDWNEPGFAASAAEALDKGKPVLVYCKAGGRSSQAAAVLVQNGFTQVYNLTGGITAWESEGLAIQK